MHLDCNCKQEKASFYGMEAEAVWGSEAWEKKESRKDWEAGKHQNNRGLLFERVMVGLTTRRFYHVSSGPAGVSYRDSETMAGYITTLLTHVY